MSYLTFQSLDSYLRYLKDSNCEITSLTLTQTYGEPHGKYGVREVQFWAVFSARLIDQGIEVIPTVGLIIGNTNELRLRTDADADPKDQAITQVRAVLEEAKVEVEEKGFTVTDGLWTLDRPFYFGS